jgi:two-component system alkaline phosphatase synthesis response regulator PhoP
MVYLVEDDKNIRELVVYTLNSSGIESRGFKRASEFWEGLKEALPDLILLDIMLPDEDGISILKKLRNMNETKKLPIIMVTAKGSEYDKVIGLDAGADDYIPKPFGMMELVARVKANLRRMEPDEKETEEYVLSNLKVNQIKHKVYVDEEEIILTFKEFELLCYLLDNKDVVLTRDKILTKIWGYNFDGETRTVDVHIRMLRQKLKSAGELIETIRGIGYKISKSNRNG